MKDSLKKAIKAIVKVAEPDKIILLRKKYALYSEASWQLLGVL
jgi:hypothetical protein